MGCAIALLVLNFICVCLAVAGNVAALTGYSWWKSGNGRETGLWRYCEKKNNLNSCTLRSDLFQFDRTSTLDIAIVLLLMIASCGFLFFALISTLSMFCCMRSKGCWCCGAATTAIKLFLGAGAGIAAMVYAEIKFETEFKITTRGWSNIVGWVGSGLGLIAFVLSAAMCCVKPSGYRGGNVNVVVNPPYAAPQSKEYPMVNRGYQHGY